MDEFAGGAYGGVEDEAHPGEQQPQREADDTAEPEQEGQSRTGGRGGGDGLLVEVAGVVSRAFSSEIFRLSSEMETMMLARALLTSPSAPAPIWSSSRSRFSSSGPSWAR